MTGAGGVHLASKTDNPHPGPLPKGEGEAGELIELQCLSNIEF